MIMIKRGGLCVCFSYFQVFPKENINMGEKLHSSHFNHVLLIGEHKRTEHKN